MANELHSRFTQVILYQNGMEILLKKENDIDLETSIVAAVAQAHYKYLSMKIPDWTTPLVSNVKLPGRHTGVLPLSVSLRWNSWWETHKEEIVACIVGSALSTLLNRMALHYFQKN